MSSQFDIYIYIEFLLMYFAGNGDENSMVVEDEGASRLYTLMDSVQTLWNLWVSIHAFQGLFIFSYEL